MTRKIKKASEVLAEKLEELSFSEQPKAENFDIKSFQAEAKKVKNTFTDEDLLQQNSYL